MPENYHLINITLRHQVYLERLKSGVVANLQAELGNIQAGILEIIDGLESDSISELTKRQMKDVLRDLREMEAKIMMEGLGSLSDELVSLAGYEAVFEAKALKKIIKGMRINIPKAKAAYKAALERPLSSTGELLESFIKGWEESEIRSVENLFRKAYAEGWTNQQLKKAIRGTKKLNYSDGLMPKVGRNADAMVRTSMQHVSSCARFLTWEKNADLIKGYEIVATLDGRTTAVCRSLDGKKFDIGKGPMPPLHVRCRTTTVPVLDSQFDFLDEGATRSSKDGYVDANTTYYGWLKSQPEAFQDSVLGPSRGKLFRDGGLSAEDFARLNLGRNFKPLTLDEMKKMEPLAFERAGL